MRNRDCSSYAVRVAGWVLVIGLLVPGGLFSQAAPRAQLPVLITSAGQSPGGTMMRLLFNQNNIQNDFVQIAEVSHLRQKQYKTLVLALGTSLKGMGAAGIDFGDEMKRIQSLIDEARRQKVLLLGFHIEGDARRGGYDEDLIAKIPQLMDYLVVRKDGNADGIFTDIAKKHGVPLLLVDKTLDVKDVLKQMFQ